MSKTSTTIQPTASTRILHAQVVTQTYANPDPRRGWIYEIHLAPDFAVDSPRMVLHTRDEAIYHRAVAAEGWERRFDAEWTYGKRPTGKRVQVLLGLEDVQPDGTRCQVLMGLEAK